MSSSQLDVNTLRLGDARLFIQLDGISPANPYEFMGCTSFGEGEQGLGEPEAIYCPSPDQRNGFTIIDSVPKAPELGSVDFTHMADRFLRDIWWDLKRRGCQFNAQAIVGRCSRPDDPDEWDGRILYKGMRMTNFVGPAINPLDPGDNSAARLTGTLSFEDFLPILRLNFGEEAAAVVVAEVLDGIYSDQINCGDCGQSSDGCNKTYWVTKANVGSPGLSSQLVSSDLDGTWSTEDITATIGVALAGVGSIIVVIDTTNGKYVWKKISDIDDSVVGGWAAVTSGFVALKTPTAIWSRSSSRTYIAANGGYVYLLTRPGLPVTVLSDGSATVQNLAAIHGFGDTVVAVGAANALIYSTNKGLSWSLRVGPAVGVALTAVWCLSSNIWLVGTATGNVYYTLNSGKTWTEVSLEADVTSIKDFWFVDDTVGYMATGLVDGTGRLYRSIDSGGSWKYTSPSVTGVPTNQAINVVVACDVNRAACGGLGTGTDGFIALGA